MICKTTLFMFPKWQRVIASCLMWYKHRFLCMTILNSEHNCVLDNVSSIWTSGRKCNFQNKGCDGAHLQVRSYSTSTVAKFIVPDLWDKVNSCIGLSYRAARLHWLAGRYDTYAGVSYIPQSGTMNLATDVQSYFMKKGCFWGRMIKLWDCVVTSV